MVSAGSTAPALPAITPTGVNLVLVHSDGSTSVISTLNDAGRDGDLVAGDGIFTGNASVNANETQGGLIHLKALATFPGIPDAATSEEGLLQEFPANVHIGPPAASPAEACGTGEGDRFICCHVLVFARPGNDYPEVENLAKEWGGAIGGVIDFPRENIWIVLIHPDSTGKNVMNAINSFAGSSTLRAVSPDYITQSQGVTPNDSYYSQQWGVPAISLDKAWAITTGTIISARSSNLYIGIVDSGVDTTHPDLNGRKVNAQVDWTTEKNGPNNNVDGCGHGTGVASVAAATGNNNIGIAGASWSALIIAEKVGLKKDTHCPSNATLEAAAIKDAVNRGATVVNMSYGGTTRERASADAIDYVNKNNRVFVTAAGNCGVVSLPDCPAANPAEYPAAFASSEKFPDWVGFTTFDTHLVSVGATTKAGPVANFSNFNQPQEIYAPGAGIIGAVLPGDLCLNGAGLIQTRSRVCAKDGTSFAAPLIAGVLSLMRAARPLVGNVVLEGTLVSQGAAGVDLANTPIKIVDAFASLIYSSSIEYLGGQAGFSANNGLIKMSSPALRTDTQVKGVYGASIPLLPASTYEVDFVPTWKTWDSYSAKGGYFDAFSMSISPKPYAQVTRGSADLLTNDFINFGYLEGGRMRGSRTVQTDATKGAQVTRIMNAFHANLLDGNNYLNFVLDTSAGPNADTLWPSWGTFKIVDITPHD